LLAAAMVITAVLVIPADAATLAADSPPTLVDVRAAHYPGYDRLVFEFAGGRPDVAKVRWAKDLRLDPSDKVAHVQGSAFLKVKFRWATAHELEPPTDPTFGPARRAYDLPNIAHVVLLGDYEGVVTFGVGLMKRTRIIKTIQLSQPYRFVIHVATTFPKGKVKVFFFDQEAVNDVDAPLFVPVTRKVPKGRRAVGALQRLYAGPTAAELDAGLRFVASGTRGFRNLWVNDRKIARVTLKGPCDSGGSALVTVANLIMPTLRSRPPVDWVKIYDRHGVTEEPWGLGDSIPFCLEP
jgi:hypothetical protein